MKKNEKLSLGKQIMKVNTKVFDCLEQIASKHGITDTSWADSSGVTQPTISHLRRTSRELKKNPDTKTGRLITIDKIIALYDGLYRLKGDLVVMDIAKCARKEDDLTVKMLLLVLTLENHTEEIRKQAASMLEILSNTPRK